MLEEDQDNFIVEVYSDSDIKTYRANSAFASFELIEEIPHFYKQVPVTVFSLNKDEASIFSQIIGLQDAYNSLISDEVDDFDAFCDSYLILKGVSADEEDLAEMKKSRVLMLDSDADASYLTKAISDTQIENMLTNINEKIHRIANSPDFSDEKFLAQSGIAMRYKLTGFENTASSIESQMRKAITKRIELIASIVSLKEVEFIWRDVDIKFTRNLPLDLSETVNLVVQLQGIVSQKTLLSLLPFIKDVDAELEAVKEEKEANMSLYGQGLNFNSEVDDELLEDKRINTEAASI